MYFLSIVYSFSIVRKLKSKMYVQYNCFLTRMFKGLNNNEVMMFHNWMFVYHLKQEVEWLNIHDIAELMLSLDWINLFFYYQHYQLCWRNMYDQKWKWRDQIPNNKQNASHFPGVLHNIVLQHTLWVFA